MGSLLGRAERANDHMARCARLTVLPSSLISLKYAVTCEVSGVASFCSFAAWPVIFFKEFFKERETLMPNIQISGTKAPPALIARISPVSCSLRTLWTKSVGSARSRMRALSYSARGSLNRSLNAGTGRPIPTHCSMVTRHALNPGFHIIAGRQATRGLSYGLSGRRRQMNAFRTPSIFG